ncbi:DUF1501 domain-containing protein [Comamonadaceae bacterium G21597-S1]|nr:DUF1501 domain-containing protein [Comamonadaceae bacterium G21597-S1]
MTASASRRAFLQRASVLSMVGAAAPWALNLAAFGEAAAATATDYKALVCIFLHGGNDNTNTLVPFDTASHAAYQAMRPTFAYSRSALAGTALTPLSAVAGGYEYALAPELATLHPLFGSQKLAVLLNVGALVEPTSKAQYIARSVSLPPKLFSHNDQQSVWQSSATDPGVAGWGGRMGDLLESGNGNASLTCVNVSGNAVFLSGSSSVQYQVSPRGPVALDAIKSPLFGSTACSATLRALAVASSSHLLEDQYAQVMARALSAGDALTTALAAGPTLVASYPDNNNLGGQLKMVARMIGSAAELGVQRQVFFVSMGGFDNHNELADKHPALLAQLAGAMDAFYKSTVELGVADKVTTFTASEFGRTITGASGSDHGWGSTHFVMGDAVAGGRYYGSAPEIANNGPDDAGQGRLIPSTSVDQYAATLGKWFGISETDLLTVLPNLAHWNLSQRDLGFM